MRHRDLANKLALWAWGKVIPNEITELEKFILRGLEEVSAQQPEDEIKHGMAFIEKSIEQEVTELVHTTFGGAEYYNSFIPKLMEILAKHKERR